MRATAVFIHPSVKGKKRKRETEEHQCNSNGVCECNKENAPNSTLGNKDSIKNDLSQGCGHLSGNNQNEVGLDDQPKLKKVQGITHNIVKYICDTIHTSANRILPSRLFFSLNNNSENKIASMPVSMQSNTNNKLVQLSTPSHATEVFSLPLNDFCINKRQLKLKDKNQIFECRINLRLLPSYIKRRNSQLRRSKTVLLARHIECSAKEICHFLTLIEEDPLISLFLKRDICRRYADKYLLAMVIVYFVRSRLKPNQFTREQFFAALYLAHDMEEDLEEMKYEIFPFCMGPKWRNCYNYLLTVKDDIFWAIDCRAVVSRKCCEQVMDLVPDHWMWERDRPDYHGHVFWPRQLTNEFACPKGPFRSPLMCRFCLERECSHSENSYIVYTDNSSFSSQDPLQADISENYKKDSGFESFLCQNDDDISTDMSDYDTNDNDANNDDMSIT